MGALNHAKVIRNGWNIKTNVESRGLNRMFSYGNPVQLATGKTGGKKYEERRQRKRNVDI